MERKTLSAAKLAGGSPLNGRVENDFYATPFGATMNILDKEKLEGSILEPAAGQGHIGKVLREYYPDSEIVLTDLVEREDKFDLHIESGIDFLTHDYDRTFNNVITNPPFSLAQEFIEKALEISTEKVIIFAKIQLLESSSRREMFERTPPARVYVFTNRVSPLRDGKETDEKGKPWASTMCFAWFVWDKNYNGEPIIRWL